MKPIPCRCVSPADAANIELLAWKIVHDVSELPNRTSPDDRPEMMLVTAQELHDLVVSHFALSLAVPERPEVQAMANLVAALWRRTQRTLLPWATIVKTEFIRNGMAEFPDEDDPAAAPKLTNLGRAALELVKP